MPPIALLTDFGTQDAYVGVMKGVIAAIAPQVICIDLTHAVPPQDILVAQFHLMTAYPYFPAGTIYLVVVDPGVGGDRRAVAVQFPWGTVVCPDNGLLTGLLSHHGPASLHAVALVHAAYWRTPTPSGTFHGRDIFAPVAARLALGTALNQVGQSISPASLVQPPELRPVSPGQDGVIQHIDRFGNLISNIAAADAEQARFAQIGDRRIPFGTSYSSAAPGQLVALVGSHGWVEVAANGRSASEVLQARVGQFIKVRP
ncbi:MAG: S-adenosyl-l-methionine hydroxide adenosyltransferase family protein [Elainellaceae cyanobacterium]